MKKILVTGSDGRFAKVLKKTKTKHNFLFFNKKQLNILNFNSIVKIVKKNKPKYILHLAALSRPMNIHDKFISRSIDANIIGTCNLVKICHTFKIKLIYFSTNYVYPGIKGSYKETDPILPWNNYGWSKLGGECAVQMYKNSLIIRACMTEKPFIHKYAYKNVYTNFIYHKEFIKLFFKIINKKGIYNLGGKKSSIYNFAKKENRLIKKKFSKGEFPERLDMNLSKFNNLK
ncbi:MAG: ligand-binding protein, RmlD family [Pelagibacteraceae bacterium TMED216]|nr:MAG: ligand-binding protein, RmlD family [Pelagibacteraceae bacterium TMED216]|tara:strand:+ start:7472 stop:8164 length:693 start_codon:yes stop_codon:yes gene_type:complete